MSHSQPKNNANNVGQIRGRPRDFEKDNTGFNHPDDMPLGRLNPLTLRNYPVGPSTNTLERLPKFQPALPPVFEKLAEDSEYLKYGRGILEAQAEQEARDSRMENLPWLQGYQSNLEFGMAPAPVAQKVVVERLPQAQRAEVVPPTPYQSAELMRPQRLRVETKQNIPMNQPESGYYTASPRSPSSLSPF